jgi:hypothetical protein
MKDLMLLLKIGKALEEGKAPYEAIQGNLVSAEDKVKNGRIKYVAGIDHKNKHMVVGVYEPEMWYKVVWIDEKKIASAEKGRYHFYGKEAIDVILDNLNKVYDRLLDKSGYGEKVYISLSELDDLLFTSTTK